jgi:hypothetical protein
MGAPDLLRHLRDAGLALSVADGRLLVKPAGRLTDPDREAIRSHRDELLQLLATPAPDPVPVDMPTATETMRHELRPYRLTIAEGDAAHAGGWDDGEMARFEARARHFQRRGIAVIDAEDLAERLTLRDKQFDELRMCLECSHLTDRGRCMAAISGRIKTVGRYYEPVQMQLKRCNEFGLKKGLT